jgi:hypothetical protein
MSLEGGKFLDKKYPDLTGSHEVERAVDRARSDPERDFAPYTRDERIEAYLSRLESIVEDDRGWRLLKHKIIKELTIDTENEEVVAKIARGLYESEKRIAINQGRGADIEQLNEAEVLPKYKEAVHEKQDIQELSLSSWLDYLETNDARYPTWFRYFVIRNLDKMGTLNKEKGEYSKRTEYTIAPFPELNSEALGFVYRMLDTGIGSHEFVSNPEQTPEQQSEINTKRETLATLIEKKDFIKLYTFAQIETAGAQNRESLQGEWKKFEQGSDYQVLEDSLKGKGTGWCTAEGSARAHIEEGDFYVYFTRGTGGMYSEPRIAIRMQGDTVAEVRGVNHRQELEPALVEVAQAQYKQLPGGERFDKKSADMRHVTALVQKQEKNEPYTKEDLRFLYELDDKIEGFGYGADPRITELRQGRDRKKDIVTLCDCPPEAIATDINDITTTTEVFCRDQDDKLSFVDFREEKNQQKLPKIIAFNQSFKETGSPARLDVSIEGGIVTLDLDQETLASLSTYETAIEAYQAADGGAPSWVYESLKGIPWTPPSSASLDVHILDHGRTTTAQRDQLVADMDKAGYRPLTFAELVALGITRPDLNKRNEVFNTYEKHTLVGDSHVPCLYWDGDERNLFANHVSGDWSERDRFVFVRK